MRKLPLLLIGYLSSIPLCGFSQAGNNLHKKAIPFAAHDTITLDSLSIIPGSFKLVSPKSGPLDSTCYTLDVIHSRIILNKGNLKAEGISGDSLYCSYKTFPFLLGKTIQHKDNNIIHPTTYNQEQGYAYDVGTNTKNNDPFELGSLSKSGSIARGVTFGNSQNLTVNSSLNLQLAGKLSNNVNVLVAATDNNLPIQAEGNTQQLQDFDKVFVKLYNQNTSLIAGDYELQSPQGYFMKFYKKSQGGLFTTRFVVKPDKDSTHAGIMKVTIGGAISKGKYARDEITPIDGNLGPYRLSGSDNENFIIILSGTEQVYLDGQLVLRGQNNDYVIDYNAAQITFTAKHLITQNTRIVVEFQYSDLTYLRSLVHAGTEYHDKNMNLHFNIYSEQDAKNQPLSQSLSGDQINFLATVGNKIQNAVVPGIDSIAFNNTEVLYARMPDTTIGSTVYPRFIYSTDSTKAHYRLSFTQLGPNQGDYIEVASAANGRVFKWVAPVGGIKQGNYEPEILLITPKKKQMATLGGDIKVATRTTIIAEAAVSNNDVNTFSTLDKGQDVGFAGKFAMHNVNYLQDSVEHKANLLKFTTDIGYEGTQKNFSPIERYRTVEFSRDWNRTSDSIFQDQHLLSVGLTLNNKRDLLGYSFQAFLEGTNYNATRHTVNFKMNEGKFGAGFSGSLLNTKTQTATSNYYKELGTLSYKIFHWVIGGGEGSEKDIFRSRKTDSIITTSSNLFQQANTFQYFQWNTFIRSADTAKTSYGVNYLERTDYVPKQDELRKSLYSKNISFDINFLKNPKSRFKANVTYHILSVFDSTLAAGQQPVNALVGQGEYDLNAAKGLIFSSTFYQAGSGLQPKETYTYIQVAQGQGVYAWTDFNGDGIKQLNEFYVAPFPDQADYIKVYTPTNQFIKTYTSAITQTFSLRPAAVWAGKQGFKAFIARFSEQLSLHIDRKTTSSKPQDAYNPFLQRAGDTNVVGLNSSFRNTVFFNQMSPSFGGDYTYSDTRNKTLLQETGGQARQNTFQDIHARLSITTKWMIEAEEKFGHDISNSDYFTTNNFNILYYQTQPKLNFQPSTSFRTTLLFIYSDKRNSPSLGGGTSTQQNYGLELKYNVLTKGSLSATFNYVKIAFDGEPNSPLGFEVLQGLSTGNNYTWSITYQCNISENIQLNVSYNGRESQGLPVINTGSAQVRAFF